MPRKTRLFPLLSLLAISLLLAGCGGVSAKPTVTPLPADPDSFQINLQQTAGRLDPTPNGQITLDMVANNGAGNLVTPFVAGSNTITLLQLCSLPVNDSETGCINIASFTPGATGTNMNFTFPQHGTFAGYFQIFDPTPRARLGISVAQGPVDSPGVPYRSALLPAGSLTVPLGQPTGSAPGGGSMAVVGLTAHVILKGTTPNHTFSLASCFGLPCIAVANSSFTTDPQGNASVAVTLTDAGGPVFVVMDSDGAEFITAFRVQ